MLDDNCIDCSDSSDLFDFIIFNSSQLALQIELDAMMNIECHHSFITIKYHPLFLLSEIVKRYIEGYSIYCKVI